MTADTIAIGIVTALPRESAAMRLMLDDVEPLDVAGDPNLYYVGSLPSRVSGQPHRVVLATQTHDGTRAAAAISVNLARSFPGLAHIVLCGIAGGVPKGIWGRPVHLGDVVSATRGIVDYDHVYSQAHDKRLRRPVQGVSAALLAADGEIQAKELLHGVTWTHLLDGAHTIPPAFARPAAGTDPYPGGTGAPAVHRAAIGSADRLLKDAVLRDSLADDHEIVAVEMEGSGVAVGSDLHGLHWYVVRGICDYADERKNEGWQHYAALTAAAYTRTLLGELPAVSTTGSDGRNGRRVTAEGGLGAIVEALWNLPVMQDETSRHAVLGMLPSRIRSQVPAHNLPRLQLVALVRTCERYPDGLEQLCEVLTVAMGDTAPELPAALVAIRKHSARGRSGQ